jgi:Zn-finger nucleic acid-binding protein
MKCISCEIEIDPKWRHAIEINVCPNCGNHVVEELLKSLLSTLRETMEKLQAYPAQLDDWLLSNHNYIKTDSANLIDYVPEDDLKKLAFKEVKKEIDNSDFDKKKKIVKVKTDRGEEDVLVEKIQSDTKTAEFFERAELIKRSPSPDNGDMDANDSDTGEDVELQPIKSPKSKNFKTAAERTKYLKGLKEKIESEAKGQKGVVGKENLAAMMDPDIEASPEDVAEYSALMSGSDMIASGLPSGSNDDEEDAMAKRVLSMNLSVAARQNNGTKGADGGYNEKDARALQNLVNKASGNNMGGGFSRSG